MNNQLEILQRIFCMGQQDIEEAFKYFSTLEHVLEKYSKCRSDEGAYGNFKFIFELDTEHLKTLFNYLGFESATIKPKGYR